MYLHNGGIKRTACLELRPFTRSFYAPRAQFHQHSMYSLYALWGATGVKAVRRTLMKSSPDLKSAKNTVKPSAFFALLRSANVKALSKMLVK